MVLTGSCRDQGVRVTKVEEQGKQEAAEKAESPPSEPADSQPTSPATESDVPLKLKKVWAQPACSYSPRARALCLRTPARRSFLRAAITTPSSPTVGAGKGRWTAASTGAPRPCSSNSGAALGSRFRLRPSALSLRRGVSDDGSTQGYYEDCPPTPDPRLFFDAKDTDGNRMVRCRCSPLAFSMGRPCGACGTPAPRI